MSDVRRLRELEQENAWLKRIVAARSLESGVMREVVRKVVSVPARRRQVQFATSRDLSCHRAYHLCSSARSAPKYESRLDERDTLFIELMRELSQEEP